MVGEIAAASHEQADGVEQVNKAVAEMDKVVQQNAANAEESASAAEEMNAQAEQMKGSVEELMRLVGGNNGKKDTRVGKKKSAKHLIHHHLAHPIRKTNGKAPMEYVGKVSPSQVIPLEDADFTDDF